jgi:hypothetical protein
MERHLWTNAKQARYIIGGFCGGSLFIQQGLWRRHLIEDDVYGIDGNGGHMIKILTNLTDEEMARLKYVRRLYWHWRGTRTMLHGKDQINNQELADRGIEVKPEPYIEYVKRPPHDKYL